MVQGAGLLAASVLTIPAARFIDRGKCGPVIAAAVGCNLLGLLGVSFSTAFVPLLIGVFGAGAGYILVLQALTAWIKNLYPEDQRGQFEGVKQLFFVCVPMIVGPAIATPVINAFGVEKIVNGVAGMVPGNSLFLISGLVTLLALLPLFPAARMEKARGAAVKCRRPGPGSFGGRGRFAYSLSRRSMIRYNCNARRGPCAAKKELFG